MSPRITRPTLVAGVRIGSFLPLHLDPFEIDEVIGIHGNTCEYRKAVVCPCARIETSQGAVGCKVCNGQGWAYPEGLRCLTRFLDSSRSGQARIEPTGAMVRGDAQVTFRIGIIPSLGDLVLPECDQHVVMEQFHRDVQQISARSERTKLPPRAVPRPLKARSERLLYPDVFTIEAVTWIDNERAVVGVEGLHYRQQPTADGGLTIGFLGEFGPAQGEGYTVRYVAQAAYMVRAGVPLFRHEGDVAMPYKATMARLDKLQEADLR